MQILFINEYGEECHAPIYPVRDLVPFTSAFNHGHGYWLQFGMPDSDIGYEVEVFVAGGFLICRVDRIVMIPPF